MKAEKVQQLAHGVYRVYWKSGGSSVAAVGSKHNGDRWICPSNWTSSEERGTDDHSRGTWKKVKRMELIATQ